MKKTHQSSGKQTSSISKAFFKLKSNFWAKISQKREAGMGTLEVVIITGVLLTVAILFSSQIRSFAISLFSKIFNESRFTDIIS